MLLYQIILTTWGAFLELWPRTTKNQTTTITELKTVLRKYARAEKKK